MMTLPHFLRRIRRREFVCLTVMLLAVTVEAQQKILWQGAVNRERINVYASPSTREQVTATLKSGDVVNVILEIGVTGDEWCRIALQGQSEPLGYVLCFNLEKGHFPPKQTVQSEFAAASAAQRTGGIGGLILDTGAKPYPNVIVESKNPDTGQTYTTITDKDGRFTQQGLPSGVYVVTLRNERDNLNFAVQFRVAQDRENIFRLNLKDVNTGLSASAEEVKKREEEEKKFTHMKQHFDAGKTAMDDAATLRPQLKTAPPGIKASIQEKLQTDYQTAVTEFQLAEQSVPPKDTKSHAVVWSNLGQAYEFAGRYEEAAAAFAKAIELQPQSVFYEHLSTNLENAAVAQPNPNPMELAAANDACKKAAAATADPAAAARCWKNLGIILSNSGHQREAIAPLQKASDTDPQDTQTRLLLVTAHSATVASTREGDKVASIGATQASGESSNPRSRVFAASADVVFKASLRAAAGHHIMRTEDEGLKQLGDNGQEILNFGFLTTIRGFAHGVIASVKVEPIGSDSSHLTIFFLRQGGTNVWIPSTSFEARKAELEIKLQTIVDALENQKWALQMKFEEGGISLHEKLQKEQEIEDQRHAAKIDEIEQVHDAQVADLAQMPTSTFPAMVAAANSFFDLVDRNLTGSPPPRESRANAEPSLLHPATLTAQAPSEYDVKFATTKGDFVIRVVRAWAPLGADRFYNLVKNHFYDVARFFRCVDGFVVQFGLTGNPAVNKAWKDANIKDDPVKASNKLGFITFAMAGKGTRTTQVYINLGDNSRLDAMGFAPFGQVTSGMDVVQSFYSGYADAPTLHQAEITNQGNAYLEKNFPMLDTIKTAIIVSPKSN